MLLHAQAEEQNEFELLGEILDQKQLERMRKAVAFLYPYLNDKSSWPHKPDVQAWEGWPARQPALLFAGPSAFAQVRPEIDAGTYTAVSDVPPPVTHIEVHQASPFWVFGLVVLIAVATTLLIQQLVVRTRPMFARRLRSA